MPLAHDIIKRVRSLCEDVAEQDDVRDGEWEPNLLQYLFGDATDNVAANLQLLAEAARSVVAQQPTVVEVDAPCKIFGDIHGQCRDMLLLLSFYGFPGDECSFVFNGDF